jgi:hypothetical protein
MVITRQWLLKLFASAVTGWGFGATSANMPPFDITGVEGGGQSLSLGNAAIIVDAGSIYGNLAINDDAGESAGFQNPASPSLYFESNRVNPIRATGPGGGTVYTYPTNIEGDTGLARFQDQLTVIAKAAGWPGYLTVQDSTGESGTPLSGLDVGTIPFDAGAFSADAIHRVAARAGKTAGVGLIVWIHGEADAAAHNFAYGSQLVTFRTNWETAMALRTGQDVTKRPIRLYLTGEGTAPYAGIGQSIANAFWIAATSDPRIVYVGPRYQYDALYAGDGVHMTDYKPLNELYAKAYFAQEQGKTWQPVWPTAFSRASNVVTLTFNMPVGPLVFDAAGKTMHASDSYSTYWANGWGFEALDQRLPGTPSAIANNGSGLVRVTWANHGRATNDVVFIENIFNATFVPSYQGTWTITKIDANTFDLQGSTFVAGTYVTGFGAAYLPLTITTNPTIAGNQVMLTLNRPPVGNTLEIAYAHRAGGIGASAPTGGWHSGLGRGGALRDSDPFVGLSGFANPNWAIEFNLCPSGASCADDGYSVGSPVTTN